MNCELRLPRALYARMFADLARPHPFASERVGLLFGRVGSAGAGTALVLASRYEALADDVYRDDPGAGATIDGSALRDMLQTLVSHGECFFHVHRHPGWGAPRFSETDLRSLAEWMPAISAAARGAIHGGLVLSEDRGAARVWRYRGAQGEPATRITLVGYPITIWDTRGAR